MYPLIETHKPDKCYFKERDCYSCHVRGHKSRLCRNKKQVSKNRVKIIEQVAANDHESSGEEDVYTIYPVKKKRVPSLTVDIRIANKNISLEIDTGASLIVIGKHSYDKLLANKGIKLTPFKGTIKTNTGEVIKPIGVMKTDVVCNNQKEKLPLVILDRNGPSILGRKTVQSQLLNDILNIYGDVFENKTGTLKDTLVHIQ